MAEKGAVMDQFEHLSMGPLQRAYHNACNAAQDWANNNPACMQNAYSPDNLTRDQLKRLLGWNASPHVTDAMLVIGVKNRLHLGRLQLDDVAAAHR